MTSSRLRTIWLAAFAIIATSVSPALAADEAEEFAADSASNELVIEGGGWGHGIGMSQYGAYGQALAGKTGEEIVGYYYSGSGTAQIADQVGPNHFLVTDNAPLWVGLLTSKTVFRFEAVGGALTACQAGAGGCAFAVNPGEVWKFVALGDGTCQYTNNGEAVTPPGECRAQVQGMSPSGAHIKIMGLDAGRNVFARGIVKLRTPNAGAKLHVALEINLEEYLYGLAEVPFSWHREALRAQTLAGRSYAAWRLISRGPEADFPQDRKTTCWCHMYATTADQSYSGWANEAASGGDKWRAAVDSTGGTVITHPGASQANVVAAFYSSSTGGRTENNEDMWGGSPIGYLRSKADPWSQAPEVRNPFGLWTFGFAEQALATAYGVDKVDGIEILERFASGTPRVVHVHTRSNGEPETIVTSGPGMYTKLGLRGRHIRALQYGSIAGLVGDFTGDGRDDVSMVVPFSQSWWVGKSTAGRFLEESWMNQTVNESLRHQVTGDFNGDGRTDVAGLQPSTGKLLVGMSRGTKLRLEKWADHIDPTRWGPLLVGDFTGDGKDDIAEYDSVRERWRVYHRLAGEVVKEYWYDFSVSNPKWGAFAAGDYDGDGFDDILSLDANTGDLITLFSDGTGFTPTGWQSLPNDGDWQFVQAADFDGNGRADLAAYDPVAATWWVVRGLVGDRGAVPQMWFTYVEQGQNFVDQVAGDFTGDGKADIASYVGTGGKLRVLASNGQGFARDLWGTVPAKRRVSQVMAGDVNGDGLDDVVLWDNDRRRWWVARSGGDEFVVTKWGQLLR